MVLYSSLVASLVAVWESGHCPPQNSSAEILNEGHEMVQIVHRTAVWPTGSVPCLVGWIEVGRQSLDSSVCGCAMCVCVCCDVFVCVCVCVCVCVSLLESGNDRSCLIT